MEHRNASPSIHKPSIQKDDFEFVRRPKTDEIPDAMEIAELREACRRARLGRAMLAETLIKNL